MLYWRVDTTAKYLGDFLIAPKEIFIDGDKIIEQPNLFRNEPVYNLFVQIIHVVAYQIDPLPKQLKLVIVP
jgi:hypothetical protein